MGRWGSGPLAQVEEGEVSHPVFMPKLSIHRMHDPGFIVPHIRPKAST
jgi:hypothetical protein